MPGKKKASGLTVSISGFSELLEQLERAGKDSEELAKKYIRMSAFTVEKELRRECARQNVPESIINAISVDFKTGATYAEAHVGWKLGTYDPRKPAIGYLALFLNYGAERRYTRRGDNRGYLTGKKFITKAKSKSKMKVEALHQAMLYEIMEELKK